ncbi:MAG: rnfB [Betaproteobacteria bacterium]|nr:rnfB [Betaproteobacteria bacterium]
MTPSTLADRIDALLPQTQCTRCGYDGCKPYAQAVAVGAADINQCPPGGAAGVVKLAQLLGRAPKPLNPANGIEQPLTIAVIDESLCIGCTLCIQACPVDAIVGAAKLMHSVLPDWCTGCDLCVAPCPVDCISMQTVAPPRDWTQADADLARSRYHARNERLAAEKHEREQKLAAKTSSSSPPQDPGAVEAAARKKAIIAAAMERARAQRAAVQPKNTEVNSPEVQRQIDEAETRRAHLHAPRKKPNPL